MLAKVTTAVLAGVEALLVSVECDLGNGLPAFIVVGLPDVSVQEARDRVRPALVHSGEEFPMVRITVNLAPSDVRKQGPGLDLALALAVVVAADKAPQKGLEGRVVLGELGLNGHVRAVRGALAAAEAAAKAGIGEVLCPAANAAEAALAGVRVIAVETLRDALEVVRGRSRPAVTSDVRALLDGPGAGGLDLAQVRDQASAKRALEIAAAGGHNMLLSGPPGAGKTLLARALPGILPRLTVDEALEITRIHSAAGMLPPGEALIRLRPFQAPHHGVSLAGLVGGGSGFIRPGSVTVSHRGVLFLDEFPEFPRSCLEALRQPLEDGVITIVRGRQTVTYPARFMLVAAMNPCPCGHAGSPVPCRCTPRSVDSYRSRLSGPLLDRIDLHVHVPRVDTERLLTGATAETSGCVRARVEQARNLAAERGVLCNAELAAQDLIRVCALDEVATRSLTRAAQRHRLSARAVHRLLRVGRTIADLDGRDAVAEQDLFEALGYRVAERRDLQAVSL